MSPKRSSFVADLRSVLAESGFRRLFATRLVSQCGDGVFNAGLGAYVFFSAQMFPDPASAALAFAVLYLPYSLIGPFAGVFIDRWSRRQILVWSAVVRAGFVVISAILVATGTLGLPLYIAALAVLGVNRFFLSALSAALPHVVPEDKLVMANSVAPTSGTIIAFAGGVIGLGVHLVTGGGRIGSAATMLAAGACYLASGLVGATMRRDLLGPVFGSGTPPPAAVGTELAKVARGLAAGARHVWSRRPAAAALTATAAHRFLYGLLLLMSILLYRNYFYPGGNGNSALSHYTLVVITSALGYGAAAVITPAATRRVSKRAWIVALLAVASVVCGTLGPTFSQAAFLLIGFGLGLTAQTVAICTTTIIQQWVDDDYRGRVFSVNDMFYNAAFVLGAAFGAVLLPGDGRSYLVLLLVAAGYLVAAAGYAVASRHVSGASAGGSEPSPGTSSPSPLAQRSNS
jgi:MFS family permease